MGSGIYYVFYKAVNYTLLTLMQMTWIERFLKAAITDVGVPFPIKVLLKLLTPEFNKLKRL